MSKITIINGPSLNKLDEKEVAIYGTNSLEEINERIKNYASELKTEIVFRQYNNEGDIAGEILQHNEGDRIIINAGAYSHTSYVIRDAIVAAKVKAFEVQLTNVFNREEFRQKSVIAPVCEGVMIGFGSMGYIMAVDFFAKFSN